MPKAFAASGLVLHLEMNENVSGDNQILYDSSNNGNNGITHWGSNGSGMDCTVVGVDGRACKLDGIDDYMQVENNPVLEFGENQSFTFSAWVKLNPASDNQFIYNTGWWGQNRWLVERRGTDVIRFEMTSGGITRYIESSTNVEDGLWHYITAIRDGNSGELILYIDGVREGVPTGMLTGTLANGSFYRLGTLVGTLVNYLDGTIDDVRIYDYALNQEKILEDMGGLPQATGGLSVSFSVSDNGLNAWQGEVKNYEKNNLNYSNLDLPEYLGDRVKASTPYFPSVVSARGEIYLPQSGNYRFRAISSARVSRYFGINDYQNNEKYSNPDQGSSVYFEAGYYSINAYYFPSQSAVNPYFRFEWMPPGSSSYEAVPADNLLPWNWDETEISIPDSATGDRPINYLVAGTGINDNISFGTDPEIEIQLPSGKTASDVWKDDVWLFWQNSNYSDLQLRIKNVNSGSSEIINGTRFQTVDGIKLSWLRGKIPASLMTDSSGKFHFSFPALSSDCHNGISMVLVYDDATKPAGTLKIKTVGEGTYLGAAHPITFSGLSGRDLSNLKPFFVFPDGASKGNSVPNKYRANFLAMNAGSGAKPAVEGFFARTAPKIFPENPGTVDMSNTDRWYPSFGREGSEIDILASDVNYAPNLTYGDYVTGDKSDGILNSFSVPSGTEWISFQWASSNFSENYATSNLSGNESGGPAVMGILSYSNAPEPKLLICPETSTTILNGSTAGLGARYWNSFSGTPDCEDVGYSDVSGSASWVSDDPSKVEVDSGEITGRDVTVSPVRVTAEYGGLSSYIDVNVTAPSWCTYKYCDGSTGYQCVEQQTTAFPCNHMSNCTDAVTPETCDNRRHWQEVAP